MKALPLGSIQSRNVLAILFSLYGDSHDVSWLMQRLSHSSRAYFINAGLLKGFLVPLTFHRILNLATEEEVQALSKHQHIDMRTVIEKLESIEGKDEKL